MERAGPLRGLWRRGVAMSEVMKGSSLILPVFGPPVQILPQQQAPHLSSASTPCSTIQTSHFQPSRLVRQHSSLAVGWIPRHQRQRVLLMDRKAKGSTGQVLLQLLEMRLDNTIFRLGMASTIPGARQLVNHRHISVNNDIVDIPSYSCELGDIITVKNKQKAGTFCVKHFPSSFNGDVRPLEQQRPWSKEKLNDAFTLYPTREPTRTVDVHSFNGPFDESRGLQGARGYGNNVAELEARSPQIRVRAPNWREAAMIIEQNRNPSQKVVVGIESRQQNSLSRDWSRDTVQGNGNTHMHSAGTTSEAIAVFQSQLQQGITPDSYTYVKVLQMCLKQKDLLAAKQVHECIIQSRFDNNPYVANTLLNVYLRCGKLLDARRVFDELEKKTVVTWTIMIAGYAKYDQAKCAFEIFNQMRQEGCRPDLITYLSILKACSGPLALKWGKEVHVCIRQAGFESDVRVRTALLKMYAKCGGMTEARQVFENLTNRDVIIWTVMIGGLAQHGCGHEAYRLFLRMRREGFEPDAITYISILRGSASAGALEWVKEVHGHASNAGLESDLRVANALVHMYAESGSIDDARRVFDRMEKRDVVTWNAMIGGLAHHGCAREALELFRQMNADHVKPDMTTLGTVLSACCHGGLVDDGRRLFSSMTQDYGIEPTVVHYTCIVDLLGRAGHLEEAHLVIRDMPIEPNVVTWTALLGACRTYGNVELGELVANELFKLEPSNASVYVLLSNIYAAAGKWEKVALVRTIMQERGIRKEPGRSWIEVDSKIHEFCVGDTSHPEAKAIYSELNKLTEMLKAEGYIADTGLVLRDVNEEDKQLALCSHSEKLAIAYGLIHIPREEPIRVRKNLRVCPDCHTATKLISKVTGREIIARDASRFHHFKDGVCSCGDYW